MNAPRLLGLALLLLAVPAAAETITVNTTADPASGDQLSLRAAIERANKTPEPDEIRFDIPASDPGHVYYKNDSAAGAIKAMNVAATTGDDAAITDIDPDHKLSWWRIKLSTALPAITAPLIIDGYTQKGASPPGDLRIEIDGGALSDASAATAKFGQDPVRHGLMIQANGCTIRGLVITGFDNDGSAGINIAADQAIIEGNFIGVDPAGLRAKPNFYGVQISSSANRIGTNADDQNDPTERNLISGNYGGGVFITGDAKNNSVAGNIIGADRSATKPLPNGYGVQIVNVASSNQVGGPKASQANIIAFNRRDGVNVATRLEQFGVDNAIVANSIHDNTGLGINLAPLLEGTNQPSPNDKGDIDDGPNHMQNAPELASASTIGLLAVLKSAASTHVTGTLKTNRDANFRVEFFASPSADPSGYGEGRVWLAAANVNTSASPIADLDIKLPAVPPGSVITATATEVDSSGKFKNTSEFSAAIEVKDVAPAWIWLIILGIVAILLIIVLTRIAMRRRQSAAT